MFNFLKLKWKRVTLIGLGAVAAGFLGWYLLGNNNTTTTAQAATVSVRKGPIEVTVSGTGSVKPTVTKYITSKVSGSITKVNITNGQQVKSGDLLFQINSDTVQSAVKKAELSLQQAQLNYDTAVTQSTQTTTNPANGQTSTNQNSVASLELQLQQAKLNLSDAQTQLADCKVYATMDGFITLGSSQTGSGSSGGSSNNSAASSSSSSSSSTTTTSYWQVGDSVNSGQSLASIISNDSMTVTVAVDEVDLSKVKVGQKANITADALPDKKFQGTVTQIANEGSQTNGVARFDVTVSIDQPEGLKTNMTTNVEIMVASKEDALLLPIEAVQERQGKKFVIVPNGQSNNNNTSSGQKRAINMVTVETGLYNDTWIEITSGLKEGDAVTLQSVATGNRSNSGSTNKQLNGNSGGMPFLGGGTSSGQRANNSGFGVPRD